MGVGGREQARTGGTDARSVLLCLLSTDEVFPRESDSLPQPPMPISPGISLSQPEGFNPLVGSQSVVTLTTGLLVPEYWTEDLPLCFIVAVLGLSVEGTRSTVGGRRVMSRA